MILDLLYFGIFIIKTNLNKMLLNPLDYTISELNKIKPAKGGLLIAEPFMEDPHFKRSVILLTEYKKEGAFGFTLNKPLDTTVNDVLKDFPEFNAPVFMGGPVQSDSLFYIHTQGENIKSSQHIVGDLYWAGNFEQLKEMVANQQIFPHEIMFFIGYSGWDYEQLEAEIKEESWLITSVGTKSLKDFKDGNLWKNTLVKMGSKCATLTTFPEDPSLN